jgi:hypothetical protein
MKAGRRQVCNTEGTQAGKEACSKKSGKHAGMNKGINAGWDVRRQRNRNDGR